MVESAGYYDEGSNKSSNYMTAVILVGVAFAGALVALLMSAPWWIYAGILFFIVVTLIAIIDQRSMSGYWSILIEKGGRGYIQSPKGYIEFSSEDMLGVCMASSSRRDTDGVAPGAGYYLVLKQACISLNNSPLAIKPLENYIMLSRPELGSGNRIDLNELFDRYPDEPDWIDELTGEYAQFQSLSNTSGKKKGRESS